MKHKLLVYTVILGIFNLLLAFCAGVKAGSPWPAVRPIKRPTTTVAGGTTAPRADYFFPIGVFEDAGDAGTVGGSPTKFETMINDVEAHHMDSVMFANNFVNRDAPLLDVSDTRNFSVLMTPAGDLNESWWPSDVPANIETARSVAQPLVNQLSPHPSFKGYIVKDEPGLEDLNKVALMTQAFHELDPSRLAMPVLITLSRTGPIFDAAHPDVMLIDVYPFAYNNPHCDFTMTGFGYPNLDSVGYIRAVTKDKPAEIPLWIILQTHRFGNGELYSLREPVPAEVRAQQWLAIGEGATGIFWFMYSSQQGWTGLVDNTVLYPEVAKLAQRLSPLRNLLMGLHKVDDKFTITGGNNPYVSTLASKDGKHFYVVGVNRSCDGPQMLSISSSGLTGQLKDLETSQLYSMGEPVEFQPGDGKIFELVGPDGACSSDSSCTYLPAIQR